MVDKVYCLENGNLYLCFFIEVIGSVILGKYGEILWKYMKLENL